MASDDSFSFSLEDFTFKCQIERKKQVSLRIEAVDEEQHAWTLDLQNEDSLKNTDNICRDVEDAFDYLRDALNGVEAVLSLERADQKIGLIVTIKEKNALVKKNSSLF